MEPKKERDKRFGFFPSKEQLYCLPRVLSARERFIIIILTAIGLFSLLALPISAHYHNTVVAPDYGGSWTEGTVGSLGHLNPLLLQANDTDSDLANLLFAGLLRFGSDGKLKPDLAESYTVSDDGLTYTFKLKHDLRWHDGTALTADDVVFTIITAQNSDYDSPQRINWQGVDINKQNDLTIVFTLKNRYAQFINNTTLGILPRHIWENVKASSFGLSENNLKPIGSGPYKFSKIRKDTLGNIVALELIAFDKYALGRPYIDRITFQFYNEEEDAITAYRNGTVQALSLMSTQRLDMVSAKNNASFHKYRLPRYFGVFFNQNHSKLLSDKNARLALNYATDKQMIVDVALKGNGTVVDSPLLPGIIDIPNSTTAYPYDLEKAKQFLSGVKEPLDIEITTSSWPELKTVAETLKQQWEEAGFHVSIRMLSVPEIQQAIKERDYSALLFGEVLGLDPDPFSFWHSSQKKDPGLNLSLFDDKKADAILEDARQILDDEKRKTEYAKLQDVILAEAPAVLLYSPDYIYLLPKTIHTTSERVIAVPANRFDTVHEWYIDTRRVSR